MPLPGLEDEVAIFRDVSVADLVAAYSGWPGSAEEKAALRALTLRVRIERAAAALPSTVIATPPAASFVERRLYLSVGEPGLSDGRRIRRLRAVAAAMGAYGAICDVLHGRTPDPVPPLQDVQAWALAVDGLEAEFACAPPDAVGEHASPAATSRGA
jgi:hypothetical protein